MPDFLTPAIIRKLVNLNILGNNLRFLKILVFTIFINFLLLWTKSAIAQTESIILNPTVRYSFGEWIEFEGDISHSYSVEKATLILTSFYQGQEFSIVQDSIIEGNHIKTFLSSQEFKSIRSFTNLSYKYIVTLQTGEQIASEDESFFYEDNRFTWQTASNNNFTIHWYQGDLAFGQIILNAAQNSIPFIKRYITIDQTNSINIYVYANANQLQEALSLSSQSWVAGHAKPSSNIIFVSIKPGPEEQIEINRQIPHEITHILLYHNYGESYLKLPVWLNEGIASLSENSGFQDPDQTYILNNANENDQLIPFVNLCSNFPQDAESINRAYAQSSSFVKFIHVNYGQIKLEELANNYVSGESCESGAKRALGFTLTQLETQWKEVTFSENAITEMLLDLLPWLILLGFTMVTPIGYILINIKKS